MALRLSTTGAALLLEVLSIRDDFERARQIGGGSRDERSRSFAEVLIYLEEVPGATAVVVGMLQEIERARLSDDMPVVG